MTDQKSFLMNDTFLHPFFGLVSCLIIGLLFLGGRIFQFTDPASQFITYGVSAVVLLSMLKFSTFRNFIYVSILLLFIHIVLHRIDHIGIIFFRLLYFLGIAASMSLYYYLFDNRKIELKFGKFFVLAGIVATVMLILSLIASPFVDTENPKLFIEGQTFFALLIGIGLGIGFDIAGMIGAGDANPAKE